MVDVVVQNPQKVTSTNMRKNMYVVTPRCVAAAAALVSAVVLRRPTKEYTHPYSMMRHRLPTAGIDVAPHYHQLLVLERYKFYDHITTTQAADTAYQVDNSNNDVVIYWTMTGIHVVPDIQQYIGQRQAHT